MVWVCHSSFCALACVLSSFPLDRVAQRRSPENKQLITLPSCVCWLAQLFFLQTDPNLLKLPQTRWRGPARPAALAEAAPAGPARPQLALRRASPGALPGSGRFIPGAGDDVKDRGIWPAPGWTEPCCGAGTDAGAGPSRVCSRRREAGAKGLAELPGPFPRGDQGPSASPRPANAAAVLRLIWLTESLRDFGWGGRKPSLEGACGWLCGCSLEVLWEHTIESGKWIRDPLAKRKLEQHMPVWDNQPGAWGWLMGSWRQSIVPGAWCLATGCLAEPELAASASEVLGLPVLFGHSLRRKETGSSQLETWILLRRLV